jgi:hypothetical protein
MVKKNIFFGIIIVMTLFNCEQEKVITEVFVEPTLQAIDLSGGVATFSYEIGTKRALYKVDENRKITMVPFSFEGTPPDEKQLYSFDLFEISHPEYFVIKFDNLKQSYFVEKKTGAVHKTVNLDFDLYYGNGNNIMCTSEALYFVRTGGSVNRVKNYLTTSAITEILPFKSNGEIFVDKEETVFTQEQNFINRYSEGVVSRVLEGKSISSMWLGNDGYFRAMDFDGAVYQIRAKTVNKEGAIPISVGYLGAYNFPMLNKTVGVQHRFNKFHIIELTPPFSTVMVYNSLVPPEGQREHIHIKAAEGMLYIHTSARTRQQRLLKINATDFSKEKDITINNNDHVNHLLLMKNDFMLAMICVYKNFSCSDKLAFVAPSGEITFAFDEGSFSGHLIQL